MIIGAGKEWTFALKKAFRQMGSMREIFDCYNKLSEVVKTLNPQERQALNLFELSGNDLERKLNKNLNWLSKNINSLKSPGGFLKAYKMIYELRSKMAYVFASIGQVDAFLSMAKLYKELLDNKNSFCFAEFIDSPSPRLIVENAWDPNLKPDIAVSSSFELGGGAAFHNAIFTGPNTGGKSTSMRLIFLSILLAQTFGLSCCKAIQLTLFHGLLSYMNVVDNVAKGMSQYYSEVYTVATAMDKIKKLDEEGKFSFFVVDEMFSGTNPEDARSMLEAICQDAILMKNSLWVISTHLPGAAKSIIEKTAGKFGGLMISFIENADGTMIPEHKIMKGISTQSTAFDVALKAGLGRNIVAKAQEIRQGLTAH